MEERRVGAYAGQKCAEPARMQVRSTPTRRECRSETRRDRLAHDNLIVDPSRLLGDEGSEMARRDDPGPDGFTEFAVGGRERLRRTAYLLCGDWDRASDLVQEALVRVYVAWPRLRHKGGAHAYARRALVSVSIDVSRKRSSGERPVPDAALDALTQDQTDLVADREALLDALRQLPDRQRACVVLRFYDDTSVAETALLLGCSEGTVKSQTSRALASLRARLSADLTTTGDIR